MKRYLLPLVAVLVMGAGCETADDDGSDVIARDVLGEGVQDTLDRDSSIPDSGGGGGGGCEQYCADMVAACPEDDTIETCMSSCQHVEAGPSDTALECAEAATDCQSARPCWGAIFN